MMGLYQREISLRGAASKPTLMGFDQMISAGYHLRFALKGGKCGFRDYGGLNSSLYLFAARLHMRACLRKTKRERARNRGRVCVCVFAHALKRQERGP